MTNWMPAARLAKARRRQEEAMPDTCTIRRGTVTYSGPGSANPVFTDLATGVPCRFKEPRRTPEEIGSTPGNNLLRGITFFELVVPYDQDVDRNDRVVVGTVTYEVIGVRNAGEWMTGKHLALVEVDT